MPYHCRLRSGKSIAIFFYDGPISQELAFGDLLKSGEGFAQRLVSAFRPEAAGPQLVHIATDGETYGHHHRFGDMALCYALYYLETNKMARITIYGEYLEKFPPTQDVEIFENTSWSCAHGVERWRNNCGCNSGMHPGWTQEWRAPLRGALDWLRDNLAPLYEDRISHYVDDPWQTRDNYIDVLLDRSPKTIEDFFSRQVKKKISDDDKTVMLKLLEMQRHALFMFTSCGWFFDEISGIETVQILQYAARSLQLARDIAQTSLEDVFVNLLEKSPSNISNYGQGAKIYEMFVKPSELDLLRVAAHYAVSSLFKEYAQTEQVYAYTAQRLFLDRVEMGRLRAAIGRAAIRSSTMLEEKTISFAVLHLGDQNILGGAREFMGEESFSAMHADIKERVMKGDFAEVILLLDKHFQTHRYSVWHLFKNEQRDILNLIFSQAYREAENTFRQLYNHHYPILSAMTGLNMKLPEYFRIILEFIFNEDLKNILEAAEINQDRLHWLVQEIKRWSVNIDKPRLSLLISGKIAGIMEDLSNQQENADIINKCVSMLQTAADLDLTLDLWRLQNRYFSIGKERLEEKRQLAQSGNIDARLWLDAFNALGDHLTVRIV